MSIVLEPGERIIKQGPANHFKGIEAVGGGIYLTDRRLVFISHAVNVQTHEEAYPLSSIIAIRPRNTLGLVPNGMTVVLADGREERFVIWGRKDWIKKILQAQGK
ncbi:MAG TPA: GRAM domain-containing protein [Anaerolineales bacterium]|nr:GRAM domain-containing protein [Anaerolineales bacterium]